MAQPRAIMPPCVVCPIVCSTLKLRVRGRQHCSGTVAALQCQHCSGTVAQCCGAAATASARAPQAGTESSSRRAGAGLPTETREPGCRLKQQLPECGSWFVREQTSSALRELLFQAEKQLPGCGSYFRCQQTSSRTRRAVVSVGKPAPVFQSAKQLPQCAARRHSNFLVLQKRAQCRQTLGGLGLVSDGTRGFSFRRHEWHDVASGVPRRRVPRVKALQCTSLSSPVLHIV